MMNYEFETWVGPHDIRVVVKADITPGEPPRLTGHPDSMHDGCPPDWSYAVFVDDVVAGWEWMDKNLTDEDIRHIESRITNFCIRGGIGV